MIARITGSLTVILTVLATAIAPVAQGAPPCVTSGSGDPTVTVCLTAPAAGANLTTTTLVSATVSATAPTQSGAAIQYVEFLINGSYVLTDFEAPFQFRLEPGRYGSGAKTISASAAVGSASAPFISSPVDVAATFSASPPPAAPPFAARSTAGETVVVAAVGDGAGGEPGADAVSNLIASWNPGLVLYLGDVYDKGMPSEFDNWYTDAFGRFNAITNPTLGNHERELDPTGGGYFGYWGNPPLYYGYGVGGWRLLQFTTECGFVGGCSFNLPMYTWMQKELQRGDGCVLAYAHVPRYSDGAQKDEPLLAQLWSLLANAGADAYLSAHDHSYQRFGPLDANGNDAATGLTEFVVGTGGHAEQARIDTSILPIAKVFYGSPGALYGALRMELSPGKLVYSYRNTANQEIDGGTITCSGGTADTSPPARPGGLAVTASEQTAIAFAWAHAADDRGVARYEIHRDGGAAVIATATGAAYRDTGLAPGTGHTYTVTAIDHAGNRSAASAPLTASTAAPEGQPLAFLTATKVTGPGRLKITGRIDANGSRSGSWRLTLTPTPKGFKVRTGTYGSGATPIALTLRRLAPRRYTLRFEATSPAGAVGRSSLSIRIPTVKPRFSRVPRVFPAAPRASALLRCRASIVGWPLPGRQTTWYRDGRRVAGARGTTLRAARIGAGHKVQCRVTGRNKAGRVARRSLTRTVRR